MLDDDALEQRRCHAAIPDALGIDHDNRTTRAHAETGRLAAFHPTGTEEETLALEQCGEECVQLTSTAIG